VAGRTFTFSDGNVHSALARYNSNGVLDTTFGTSGSVTNIFGVANEAVSSIAIQLDGKIVAAGGANFTGNSDFALARFNTALTGDPAPTLSSAVVNPSTVTSGARSTGTVTLSAAAPAGGAVVSLTSSNASAAAVPVSVTVAAGASSATFAITTSPVTTGTVVTITATYNGASKAATIRVNPILASLVLNPSTVTGGAGSTGTVTLATAAPAGGALVSLTSRVTTGTVVSITASSNGASKAATIRVNPILASLVLNP